MRLTHTGMMKTHFMLQTQEMIADDGQGGSLTQWNTVASLWGRLDRYSDSYRASVHDRLTHQVVTRANPSLTITAGQRLALNERTFLIREVRDLFEDGRWVGMYVEEE